ncbi:hypothetical protein [Streptomyces sp. NPDC127072]|uniref:hypothetical protein n=1 Tax=Streptomyces sp. NPDC127072 TaxID=3347129 RepID=UPI0036513D8B
MAINKIKLGKAITALTAAGMDPAMAKSAARLLNLDAPLAPQIADLVEEDPELFGLDADGNEIEAEEDAEDDKSKTALERQIAILKGEGTTEFVKRMAYRRPADAERPSNASKAAREAAAHLVKNTTKRTPPVVPYVVPNPLNHGPAAPRREIPESAKRLAARLTGN